MNEVLYCYFINFHSITMTIHFFVVLLINNFLSIVLSVNHNPTQKVHLQRWNVINYYFFLTKKKGLMRRILHYISVSVDL